MTDELGLVWMWGGEGGVPYSKWTKPAARVTSP